MKKREVITFDSVSRECGGDVVAARRAFNAISLAGGWGLAPHSKRITLSLSGVPDALHTKIDEIIEDARNAAQTPRNDKRAVSQAKAKAAKPAPEKRGRPKKKK